MKSVKSIKLLSVLTIASVMLMGTGCRRPYDKPTYVTIAPNETAFVIQAEGDTENQDVFKSAELLQEKMIAAKRIKIPHRWNQTGRWHWIGNYMDEVIVLKVDRSPVTRVWDASPEKGTTASDDALECESKDSLGVSSGFTLTGYIEPEDTALFLFKYKGDSLAVVIDQQVKNSIQSIFTAECGKYPLKELPLHKQDIIDAIRGQVIPFYKEWGITIAEDMGMVGGLTYEDDIQLEINNVYKAEKAKERAIAEAEAQIEVNKKLKAMAENDAAIVMIAADAEAYSIAKRAEAIKTAGDLYIKSQYITKWDGVEPKVKSGDAGILVSTADIK